MSSLASSQRGQAGAPPPAVVVLLAHFGERVDGHAPRSRILSLSANVVANKRASLPRLMAKRRLAVSDSDSDSDDGHRRSQPAASSRVAGKATRRDNHSDDDDDDDVESVLVDNSQAGLSTRDNGRGGGVAAEVISSDSEGSDDSAVEVTMSEGTLHNSGDDEGLGKWTKTDQVEWQKPAVLQDKYKVDIVIRWRWHPRRHFAQYRVKWSGYSDLYNLWEPYDSFQGDRRKDHMVDAFWKDLEFTGLDARPKGWKDGKKDGKVLDLDSDDTEEEQYSKDKSRRKAARARKRRDIRRDRKEMREAYARSSRRRQAESRASEEKQERLAEERRKKKRQEREGDKAAESGAVQKTTIQVRTKLRSAARQAAAGPLQPAKPIPAEEIPAQKRAANESQLEYARRFLPESDAKIRAERRKARLGEDAPKSADHEQAKVAAPVVSSTNPAPNPAARAAPSSIVTAGVKGPGSYRGAHKAPGKVAKWDPLGISEPPAASTASAVAAKVVLPPAAPRDNPPLASSGQPSQQENVPRPAPMRPPPGPAVPSIRAALPRPMARGAIRTGQDPRSRPSVPAPPLSGPAGSAKSPLHLVASPTLAGASPPHNSLLSPHEQPSGMVSSVLEKRAHDRHSRTVTPADRDRAAEAMLAWKIDQRVKDKIGRSYNLIGTGGDEQARDKRRMLDRIILVCKGGVRPSLDDKLKETQRKVIVWVHNLTAPLSTMEREALTYHHIQFFFYGSAGVHEIWPSSGGKVVMYTLGALVLRLVEQCHRREAPHAWNEEPGTSVLVHPWQKMALEQLIARDRIADFLRQVTRVQDSLPDKEFALVDAGMSVIAEIEEVPYERTYCSEKGADAPELSDTDVEDMTLTVDEETSRTLHKLQQEWRTDKRMFTLVMARTRLEARNVPTCYAVW